MKNKPNRHVQFGEHLCCIYETLEDKLSMLLPFLAIGLELDEKCVCITDEDTIIQVETALEEYGIDVAAHVASGRLTLRTDAETCPLAELYLSDNGENLIKTLSRKILGNGHRGYRSVIDVTHLVSIIDSAALIDREVKLNKVLANVPATMLLLYNRVLVPNYVISDIFRIHPRIIDGEAVYENSHFIPPEELL